MANGRAFSERFGDRVGYSFNATEDVGIFWSNDPDTTIGQMADEIGVREISEELERNRQLQDAARGGPPRQ